MSVRRRDPDRTRERLLEAGFHEIHRHGFHPASLDAVVERAGVTKGALYHHFPNKQALGYAVVDEVIHAFVDERWIGPMTNSPDPVASIGAAIRAAAGGEFEQGCPLNNLAQEMSTEDEGFHARLVTQYRRWEGAVAKALERAAKQGQIRADVDAVSAAAFIVGSVEGAFGLAKSRRDRAPLHACAEGLSRYLESLRVPAVERRGRGRRK